MREFELVVPCYNEEHNLQLLIEKTARAAQAAGKTPEEFQLIVVQNGSKDNSWRVLQKIKESTLGVWFRVEEIPDNRGYGFGLLRGLQATASHYVGWTHADLQTDPADAFKALKIVTTLDGRVIVKGARRGRDWKERLVSRVFEMLATLILGLKIYELNAQPKVFARSYLEMLHNPPKDFAFDLYFLFRAQKNRVFVKEIEVNFPPRIHGVSNWASSYSKRYKTILAMVKYMFHLRKAEGKA